MEKIAKEANFRLWFQLYVWKQRELSYQLIERAKNNGFEALIVTTDTIVSPNREYNAKNGFLLPFHPDLALHLGHHATPGLVQHGADEIPHHDRHAAQRELPGTVSPPDRHRPAPAR